MNYRIYYEIEKYIEKPLTGKWTNESVVNYEWTFIYLDYSGIETIQVPDKLL